MTSELKEMFSKVDAMSWDDLKALQNHIAEKLEEKNSSTDDAPVEDKKPEPHLTIGYRLSSQELEKLLFSFITPEELAEFEKNKGSVEFPTLPKTITEYIDEDREDRI